MRSGAAFIFHLEGRILFPLLMSVYYFVTLYDFVEARKFVRRISCATPIRHRYSVPRPNIDMGCLRSFIYLVEE